MANELAVAYVSIIPETSKIAPEMRGAMSSPAVTKAADDAGKKAGGRFSGAMKGVLGKAKVFAPLAAAAAGVGLVKFFGASIKAASDAQQSVGATETVFAKASDQIMKKSRSAAAAYGLSANEYRENANLIGSLFKNQGVATDQLAAKSDKMIGVAADLAATFGGDTKTAVEALGSAFKGEFDPLEQYGISIKQSTINTAAMKVAGVKTTAAFNNLSKSAQTQAKQQATTNLIFKQSKDSLGAFGRESDTLAHQQQVLSAQFEDVKNQVGKFLLPILTKLGQWLTSKVLPAVTGFIDGMRDGKGVGGQFVRVLTNLWDGAKSLLGPLGKSGGLTGLLQTMKPYLVTLGDVAGDFGSILLRIGKFLFRNVLPPLLRLAQAAYKQLTPGLRSAEKVLRTQVIPALDEFLTAIKPIIQWLAKRLLPIVKTVFHVIGVVIKDAMKIVGHIIGLATDLITGDWSGAWGHIKGIFSAVWDAIKTILRGALKIVKQLLGAAWDVVKAVTKRAWTGVKDLIGAAWDKIKSTTLGAVRWVVNRFLDFAGGILDAAAKAFSWVPGIGPKLKTAADKFADFRDSVNAKLGGIKDQHVDILTRYRIKGPSANQQAAKLGDIMAARGMATGGTVMGAPRAPYGDKVLTHLAPGEEVISNRNGQADRFRPLLKAINAGKIRGLADGGTVFNIRPRGLRGSEAKFESLAEDVGGVTSRLAGSLAAALKAVVARLGIGGPHFGGSWHKLWDLVQPMGAILTSAYRPGARTQFGNLSRHAMGKAIDIAPNYAIFKKLYAMRGRFYELLSPWGMWLRGQPYHNAAVQSIHRDHIHVSTYDKGGVLKPGYTLAYNGTGKDETILTNEQARGGRGPLVSIGQVVTNDDKRAAREIRSEMSKALALVNVGV